MRTIKSNLSLYSAYKYSRLVKEYNATEAYYRAKQMLMFLNN